MNIITEDIIALIEASLDANYTEVRSVSNRIAKSVSADDMDAAKKIKSILRRKGVPLRSSGYSDSLPVDPKSRMPLLEEHQWPVTPLFLGEAERATFSAFVESVKHQEKLIENGLSGRLGLMLSGPPGTGKTLIAGHIAAQLNRPLYVVRLDSVISSLLGDTAKNLRQIFDFVPSKNGILFLDEVDAVAKLRDDRHEVGELKRVVNTLIQGLDSLDDSAVVIAATNHAGLLDPAIWRRFPFKIRFGFPSIDVREALWDHFLYQDKGSTKELKALGLISEGLSGADIETIAIATRRKAILTDTNINVTTVIQTIVESDCDNTSFPSFEDLTISKKKKIILMLTETKLFTQTDIGRFLSLSRQTISSYLKE
ncbi:ATP-binding protein [Serratia fonticola]|uniref:AAA family ATPase n=1 Tax=Serratia fonticola TaxID=47917 RepID=UPI0027F44F18|nr:ATP-binding protein [Serratia fonticola]MDQ7207369.1 ATP-binding protein [Serratia fonticola]HBE9077603.1 ATP-binding protein [Serratia fonticola]HBE9088173.1 ATP-binding protein [Serratia fonticola]HBE9153743.1 ATP-binding protein [Serratia fonticola]